MTDHTTLTEMAKSAPPVAVASLTLVGVDLQSWVLILTAAWLVLQIGTHIWKHFIKKDK